MLLKNSQQHYGVITKGLHWLIAVCIIAQIAIGFFMNEMSNKPLAFFIHKSLGLTLLFLAIFFVLWRLVNLKPRWPATMQIWEKWAAYSVHFLLYAGILIMPLSGWLMSSAAGYPPSFWGWFTFAAPVPISKALAQFCNQVHVVAAWSLSILLAIHILAALKHRLINKDDVLQKML